MSEAMRVQPFDVLLNWILKEYEENESIFGIHRSLFYAPQPHAAYATDTMFGHHLATPFGPAAGPHTQLTQNILSAWLSGGRFIELKTVQIMDELEIPRPCIDMEDEGYNVEWSQELKLNQSAGEYVKAWVLIHVLRRLLGFENRVPFGTIFNMSVGYNLEGIQTAPMQRFMGQMEDASREIAEIQAILREQFPEYADIEVPAQLTNSVTLSTMHGCPPDEIEAIGRYLLEEKGLHTYVKLNPTLLGQETVMRILHDDLGYRDIRIPDSVFEHDLKYERAVALIEELKRVAAEKGLTFGVKLSNTLAMANHRGELPGDEMYMSGRALYPVTMNLFHKLAVQFDGDLNVSYSAGADALNVSTILAAGALPVTAASDLLKPGGYSRMGQWLENLEAEMNRQGAGSLDELAQDKLAHLEKAAAAALVGPAYQKSYFAHGLPKVESGLDLFDCIAAPCVEQCAVCQDVPEYAWLIAQGAYDQALEAILRRNPLPGVTGYVCTHLCQTRCTRNNYDEPVLIRDLKRFAAEHGSVTMPSPARSERRVAVIGSGPSGLAAAYFLALNGIQATIFETREMAGGMLAIAPHFRLPAALVQEDIERITALGVEIQLNHRITVPPQALLEQGFDAVYIASGFQKDATLGIEGMDGEGVFTALRFLEAVARAEQPDDLCDLAGSLGSRVLVIGGGNTAMDAARTAQRLTGKPATVVYRRTQAEMPAEEEELRDLFDEGNQLIELASPSRVILENGRVAALECVRNELGEPGPDGRRRPEPVAGSEFQIEADSIILAIGQKPDLAFLDGTEVSLRRDGAVVTDEETTRAAQDVYAGGDVARGPAIIIQACADGRRAAEAMCKRFGIRFRPFPAQLPSLTNSEILEVKQVRARKVAQHEPGLLPVAQRAGFDLVEQTLTEEAARAEARRCLQCSSFCDKCVEVCPNRANYTYLVSPARLELPLLTCEDGELVMAGEEAFAIEQGRQIIHVDDFCNECGNCATFCVHQGKPYTEKPRLFLTRAGFELETDNAWFIEGDSIWRREGGETSRLSLEDGAVIYENDKIRIHLSADFDADEVSLKEPFDGTISLRGAAEMYVVLEGITASAPYLMA
jgi:putative selenate reductase